MIELSINEVRVLTAVQNGCRQLIHIEAWLRKREITIPSESSTLQALRKKGIISYKSGMWEVVVK